MLLSASTSAGTESRAAGFRLRNHSGSR
uniref:Uncharacterized protein n=1 Tax=Anopheles albimanus TaxID=7167 RepID=A0A182FXM5_ANOAL